MARTGNNDGSQLTLEQAQAIIDELAKQIPNHYTGAVPVAVDYSRGQPRILFSYPNTGEYYTTHPNGNDGSRTAFGIVTAGSTGVYPVLKGAGLRMDLGTGVGAPWVSTENATDALDWNSRALAGFQRFSQPVSQAAVADTTSTQPVTQFARGGQMKTRVPKYLRDEYGRKLVRVPGWGDDDTDVYF